MATSQMSEVIERLRRVVLPRDGAGLTEARLLEDYLSRRDEAALAALVRRHGPMVWGVCRRVLFNYHDAEDAFQATFLVLVRKAASIVPREMVANWLYGVAHQTALKARATTAKRKTRERQVMEMPEPGNRGQGTRDRGLEWDDLQPLLDQELSRLADKYRAAIVLCDLEGNTRKEAARQLGVPAGTLSARLARGRALLAKRLARHGLAVSGGSLAAALAQSAASAAMPAAVASSTIKAMTAGVSVKVAVLTEGVLKSMLLAKLKTMVAVLVIGILGAVAIALSCQALASDQQDTPSNERRPSSEAKAQLGAQVPKAPADITLDEAVSRMRWSRDGKVMVSLSVREQEKDGKKISLYTFRIWDGATGKLKHSLGEIEHPGFNTFELSPDGKILAISQRRRIEVGDNIQLWDTDKAALLRTVEMDYARSRVWFAISPDNSVLAVCGCDIKNDNLVGTVRLFDTKTAKLTQKIVRDETSQVITVAFSPDGKLLATGGHKGEIAVWDLAAGKVKMSVAATQYVAALSFSPDSAKLISTGIESGVLLWDIATGKSRELIGESGGHHLAFSPDGRHVAAVGRVEADLKESWGLRVWDARSGGLRHEWPGWGWRGFTFSPDSNRLTMLVDEKTIKTVEIVTPEK